jgi:hypothetical protein
MRTAAKLTSGFTALIRWRGPDPTLEIETRHKGFPSPEEAALFANALAPAAPLGLRIGSPDAPEVLMPDGFYISHPPADTTVWTIPGLSPSEFELVVTDDADFEAFPFAGFPFDDSARGQYEQAQYAVLAPDGSRVNVSVDWDDFDHLRVTVEESAADTDTDTDASPTFALGALPKA